MVHTRGSVAAWAGRDVGVCQGVVSKVVLFGMVVVQGHVEILCDAPPCLCPLFAPLPSVPPASSQGVGWGGEGAV